MSLHQVRSGLTIIEALIAIAIIGIVFVVLASAQISNLRITSAARADSSLLQQAVGLFEEQRVEVLQNFVAYHRGCADASLEVELDPALQPDCDPDGTGVEILGPSAGGSGSPQVVEGNVLLRITVTDDRGNTLVFEQLLSCLDATNRPSLADCSTCLLVPPVPVVQGCSS